MTELLIEGQLVDLSPGTLLLPSFQANDLSKPDTIQADFSPQFTLPGTQRNHVLLGWAATGGSTSGVPYRKLPAMLRTDGVEIMPRALLVVKSYEGGRYQVQLFAGNKRFLEMLGNKTLRELDMDRFTHSWNFADVAQRLQDNFWQANGWGYEVYDRGKAFDAQAVSPFDLLPSATAWLLWTQLLAEAGFTATDLSNEPVLSRLVVPAPKVGSYPESYLRARKLVAGVDGLLAVPTPLIVSGGLYYFVPFTFTPATPPFQAPTIPGVFTPTSASYQPDGVCRLNFDAQVRVDFIIPLHPFGFGTYKARLQLFKNGQLLVDGSSTDATRQDNAPFMVTLTVTDELAVPGDSFAVRLYLESPADAGSFAHAPLFTGNNVDLPRDMLTIEVLPEVPPGGMVKLAHWLPDLKQVDFFKTIVQLLGLTVQVDDYEDRLELSPSVRVLDNVPRALDWTRKRTTAASTMPGEPQSVSFRFGSYARRNFLRWTPDQSDAAVPEGYGDGYLAVADENLPAEASLGKLPFAATGRSTAVAGLLRIPTWVAGDNGQGEYSMQDTAPRLTLRGEQRLSLVLAHAGQRVGISTRLSYFDDAGAAVELDLHRFILPTYWRGLQAMLTEARYLKETYRLTAVDVARLDYTYPIWDEVLGDFFAISKVSEFDPSRPTTVELVRLHPSQLPAPSLPVDAGHEFAGTEYSTPTEFY